MRRLRKVGKWRKKRKWIGIALAIAIVFIGAYVLLKPGPKPAKIKAEKLELSPRPHVSGEPCEISVEVSNTGEKASTCELNLVVDGEIRDTKKIALEAGETRTITFVFVPKKIKKYDIRVGGLHLSLNVSGAPRFEVSNLVIEPSEVKPPSTITISVEVVNIGEVLGSKTLQLKIDGLVEESKSVHLRSGESKIISFEVKRREPRTYSVEIGSLSGFFTVKPIVELWVESSYIPEISSTLLYSLTQEKLETLEKPLVTLYLSNLGTIPATGVKAMTKISEFGDFFTVNVDEVVPKEPKVIGITPKASSEIIALTSDTYGTVQAKVMYYDEEKKLREWKESKEILILARNSFYWYPPELVSAWVTPTHEMVRGLATEATRPAATSRSDEAVLEAAERIYNELSAYGLEYVSDVHATGDYVQFPVETLNCRAGDCDDFAVLYSSLLESIGIRTRLVLIPRHIFVGIELPSGEFQPIEPTMINRGDFQDALSYGEDEYRRNKSEGLIEAEIIPHWEHEEIKPANIPMTVPLPRIEIYVSPPAEGWTVTYGYYQDVEITFTNYGDATGMRGIWVYGTDQNGEIETIVGVGSSKSIEPKTLGPNESYTERIRFDTESGDTLKVHYNITQ